VDINGYRYIVKELSLLFTIFKRLDGTIVQVNNAILNNAWIENVRRSNTQSEVVQITVDFGTSFKSIQNLRREMLHFVENNSRDYSGDLEVEIMDAKGLDKLLLQIVIKHKSNWQNDALRAHRRNKVRIPCPWANIVYVCFGSGNKEIGDCGGWTWSWCCCESDAYFTGFDVFWAFGAGTAWDFGESAWDFFE
jgi:small-conductance mechanosensitive channel